MPEGWTLPGILESAAKTRTGVCYVGEDGRETFEAYESLYARAGAIARQLADRGFTRSQRVGLIIPETEGFGEPVKPSAAVLASATQSAAE